MGPSKRKRITFRSGFTMEVNSREYWVLREVLSKGCTIESLNRGLFRIKKGTISYTIKRHGKDLLSIKKGQLRLLGSFEILNPITDCAAGSYDCDCSNKVVLDVGGFCGETAVFFWERGAERVVVYEPVVAHHEFIKKNIMLNSVDAELHEEGIGNKNGYQTIHYDMITTGFGALGKGKHQTKIRVKNACSVIEESQAEVAKFDCEGAETSLIHVPNGILRKIDFYMIETHTTEIAKAIIDKFSIAGFKLVRRTSNAIHRNVSVVHFAKRSTSRTSMPLGDK